MEPQNRTSKDLIFRPSSLRPPYGSPSRPACAPPPDVGAVSLPVVLPRGVRDNANGSPAREHHVTLLVERIVGARRRLVQQRLVRGEERDFRLARLLLSTAVPFAPVDSSVQSGQLVLRLVHGPKLRVRVVVRVCAHSIGWVGESLSLSARGGAEDDS